MASVDDWSDSEIRSKLAELGTPVGPVTETTRKTLVKKLKKLLQTSDGNVSGSGRTRRSLSRFSSGDEDSQEDAPSMPPPSRTRTLRRRTVGPTDLTSTNDTTASVQRDSGTGTNKTVTKISRKSTSAITTVPKDDFDSGSDSDVPAKTYESSVSGRRALKPDSPPQPRTYSSPDSSTSRTFGGSKLDSGISSRISTTSAPESSTTPSRTYSNFRSETTSSSTRQYVTSRPDPLTPSLFSTSSGLDRGLTSGLDRGLTSGLDRGLTSGLDRGLTPGTSTFREIPISRTVLPPMGSSRNIETSRIYDKVSSDYRKNIQQEEEEDGETEEEENTSTGFQSEFLSRLQGKARSSSSYKPPSRDESSSRVFSRTSISPSRSTITPNIQLFDKYKGINFGSYGSRLSAATRDLFSSKKSVDYPERLYPGKLKPSGRVCNSTLMYVFIAVLAMVIMGVVYMSLGPNPLGLESDDNTYPICDADNTTQPCIESKDLQPALNLLKIIKPKLHEMAVKTYCEALPGSGSSDIPSLSETAAVEYLLKKLPKQTKSFQVEQDLRRLKILVMANPHWDIKLDLEKADADGTEVDTKVLIYSAGLMAQNVHLPITCVIRHFVYGIARWVVITAAVIGFIALVLYCYRVYKRRQEKHRRDVYSMVNKVLTMLASHYEQEKQGYLAVDNCRDELIQPMHRDAMKAVWDAAVDFIEKHESRVRTELHNVRGENVKVWRWLPAKGPPMSDAPKLDRLL